MRVKILFATVLIILMSLAAFIPWESVQADSYVVTNTNDSGAGSLRQAITDANTHPGIDNITFAATTDGSPITLAGASGENTNTTGDLDILNGGDLIIQGNGPANTIIDGSGNDRIFHICPSGGCTNTVTLMDLTIKNGTVGGGGGGIRHEAGTMVVDGCSIQDNTAINGGGISNFASLIIQNGSLIGGSGAGNHSVVGNGGGIYNFAGTLTIDNSTVSANSAAKNGGGIWNQASLNIQNNSRVGEPGSGNSAGNDGGGIHNYAGTTMVDGSSILANSAINSGGGIWSQANLNVQNGSNVSANSADNNGGGIWSHDTLNVLSGSTIGGFGNGNSAGGNGGGIFNTYLTTTIDNSKVQANTATGRGGGIDNYHTLIIQNGSIIGGVDTGNTSQMGGGIENFSGATMTVDNSTISANVATTEGGGILNFGTLLIQNGSIIGGVDVGNTASNGGGIYSDNLTTIDGSEVSANSAINGGGIYNFGELNVQNGSTIGGVHAGNTANNGGGIYDGGSTTVDGCRILNNTATSNGGGVHFAADFTNTSVTNSCIVGNSVMSIYNNWPTPQIASGNWWGAPTGPNTPGADTVLGNVNVSGFLTSPILKCAPDLQLNKSNNKGGISSVGTPFQWTLTIDNKGLIDANFGIGQVILEDDLPTGPDYGIPAVGDIVDIANSDNIDCSLADNKVTCDATGGPVTIEAVTGTFNVTFSVTPSAPVTLVNPAGLCQVDPDGNIIESDEGNNHCSPDVVNITEHVGNQFLPLVIK